MQKIINNMRTARMTIMSILAMLTVQTMQAEVQTTDKTALATAINEAETYHSSIQESNPDIASVLHIIIDAANYFDLQGRHEAQPKQKGVYIYKYNNKTTILTAKHKNYETKGIFNDHPAHGGWFTQKEIYETLRSVGDATTQNHAVDRQRD